MKSNTLLLLLFLFLFLFLSLCLTKYKIIDGFINSNDSLNNAIKFLKIELANTPDPEKRIKIVNSINYIYFIKTLFK